MEYFSQSFINEAKTFKYGTEINRFKIGASECFCLSGIISVDKRS